MLVALLAHAIVSAAIPPPTSITMTVEGSIEATLQRALPSKDASELAAQVARLMRWRGDFIRHAQRGDVMTLLYEPGETVTGSVTGMGKRRPEARRISSTTRSKSARPMNWSSGEKPPVASSSRS